MWQFVFLRYANYLLTLCEIFRMFVVSAKSASLEQATDTSLQIVTIRHSCLRIYLAEDMVQRRGVLNVVMKLRFL
jgi:hypothetical protein